MGPVVAVRFGCTVLGCCDYSYVVPPGDHAYFRTRGCDVFMFVLYREAGDLLLRVPCISSPSAGLSRTTIVSTSSPVCKPPGTLGKVLNFKRGRRPFRGRVKCQ